MNCEQIKQMVEAGQSFSSVARQLNINVGSVSAFCKKNNIISQHMDKIIVRPLPIEEIYEKYVNGNVSLDALHKEYKAPVARIKRQLKKYRTDIGFRTMDEAKRPTELNDKNKLIELASRHSFTKIAKMLGVRPNTVCVAARKFGIESLYDFRSDDIPKDVLYELYVVQNKKISQIAKELDQSYGCVLRKVGKYGFDIQPPGGQQRLSRHQQLNDRNWLYQKYVVEELSMADLADIIGTMIGNISHHLKKHNIPIRTKAEYLTLLMSKTHGVKSVLYGMKIDSKLEAEFLRSVGPEHKILRNVELEYKNSICFLDFCVDEEYIEVKSKEQSEIPGPNRRRLIKQWWVAKMNNIGVKVWNGRYYDIQMTDEDIYYLTNWKIYFEDPISCFNWLANYGFHGPQYSISELSSCLKKVIEVKPGMELSANCSNDDALKLIKHFSPYYWYSTHNEYKSISAAWEPGNQMILKNAIIDLWDKKTEVSIYGLVKYIGKFFKDFTPVSVFKPWIARHVYEKYLPNGGAVVDPCMGWGGRLLACVDGEYNYKGIDLNQASVNSNYELYKFAKSKLKDCSFVCADSSICDFPDGDLLFTSPPYDNTELYHGINSNKTKTKPIFENIFKKFRGLIALNVPKRQRDECIAIAQEQGRKQIDELQMKTASFMGRETTYEPILVFARK
jgi:hypothetical protein